MFGTVLVAAGLPPGWWCALHHMGRILFGFFGTLAAQVLLSEFTGIAKPFLRRFFVVVLHTHMLLIVGWYRLGRKAG